MALARCSGWPIIREHWGSDEPFFLLTQNLKISPLLHFWHSIVKPTDLVSNLPLVPLQESIHFNFSLKNLCKILYFFFLCTIFNNFPPIKVAIDWFQSKLHWIWQYISLFLKCCSTPLRDPQCLLGDIQLSHFPSKFQKCHLPPSMWIDNFCFISPLVNT